MLSINFVFFLQNQKYFVFFVLNLTNYNERQK